MPHLRFKCEGRWLTGRLGEFSEITEGRKWRDVGWRHRKRRFERWQRMERPSTVRQSLLDQQTISYIELLQGVSRGQKMLETFLIQHRLARRARWFLVHVGPPPFPRIRVRRTDFEQAFKTQDPQGGNRVVF